MTTVNFKDLPQIAKDLKPMGKDKCFALIQSLIHDPTDSDALVTLAQLYKFFCPVVPAKPKTAFEWCLKAVAAPKDHRPQLREVYADGGTMVATDGHRMHCTPTRRADGYYDKAGNALDIDTIYPNWQRVIPNTAKESYRDIAGGFDYSSLVHVPGPRGRDKKPQAVAEIFPRVWLNCKCLADALSNPKPLLQFWIDTEGLSPALLKFEDASEAVIMPIRMADPTKQA